MLTKVTAYNPAANLDPLVFNVINKPDTDLFEVRNIDGLGAVKADVNTTPYGSIKGESFNGTSVGKRNIVFTLGLDPDWQDWTVSKIRRLLDLYFMPELQTHLVFESMEFSPVEIFGYVESNDPNMFSKDPEHQISIICPQPDFVSVDPIVINALTTDNAVNIDYNGNVETGFSLKVNHNTDPNPSSITVHRTNPDLESFVVDNAGTAFGLDDSAISFLMDSISGQKSVEITSSPVINLLQKVQDGSKWLTMKPGINIFQVLSDAGVQNWELTYYEHFGSL